MFATGVVLDVPMRLTTPSAMGLTTLALICVCVWKDGPKLDCRVQTIDGVVLYGQYESANPGVRTSSTSMVTAKDNTTSTKLRLRTLQTFVNFTTVNADIPDGESVLNTCVVCTRMLLTQDKESRISVRIIKVWSVLSAPSVQSQ